MIELGLLGLAAVIGVFFLFAAVIGAMFKLAFGLFGAMFGVFGALLGGMFSLFGLGIAALVIVPVFFALLLPMLLPVLFLAGIVWLVVHASRKSAPAQNHR